MHKSNNAKYISNKNVAHGEVFSDSLMNTNSKSALEYSINTACKLLAEINSECFKKYELIIFNNACITLRLVQAILTANDALAKNKIDSSYRELLGGSAFTRRQIDIFDLLAKGFSNKEIADSFEISEGTVKVHINSIYRKLGVKRRCQIFGIMSASCQ